MEKYEINVETLAIIGVDQVTTKVVEINNEYVISEKAYEVMDYSCNYFGSSYSGRVAGSRKMINANYKLPIIVEETRGIIFFPTTSPEYDHCVWISLNGYEKVESCENHTTIYLKNGEKIIVNTSRTSIENQVLRASRLKYILNQRKRETIN